MTDSSLLPWCGAATAEEGGVIEAPDWVREAARRAAELHDGSLPVADLVHDSLLDDPAASAAVSRVLEFRLGERAVRLIAQPTDEGARYVVTLDPPRPVDVVLRQGDDLRVVRTDESGRAVVTASPGELGTFVVHWPDADGGSVRTAWLCL